MRDRERAGRKASPTAAVIDSQSVRPPRASRPPGAAASGATMPARRSSAAPCHGRQRRPGVDSHGRALKLHALSAAIQDRDGAGPLLPASRASWPFVALGSAEGGDAGPRVANARPIRVEPVRVEVVRNSNNQVGFAVIARRRVVKRFFAWINRNRRLAKDFEAAIGSVEAFLSAASSVLLLRRPAR